MAFADRLEAALKANDFEPLIDRAEIYAFEDWWKRIQALIARADSVVFVLSPDAIASEVCTKEIAYTLAAATKTANGTGVVPVRFGDRKADNGRPQQCHLAARLGDFL